MVPQASRNLAVPFSRWTTPVSKLVLANPRQTIGACSSPPAMARQGRLSRVAQPWYKLTPETMSGYIGLP